jgi:hypothetical protein
MAMGVVGYVGTGTLTPFKKPAHRDLLDWEKTFNTEINKIRYVIEQIIANLKTWRILHTDDRRPLATFTTTIAAVIGLHFYRTARITLDVLRYVQRQFTTGVYKIGNGPGRGDGDDRRLWSRRAEASRRVSG